MTAKFDGSRTSGMVKGPKLKDTKLQWVNEISWAAIGTKQGLRPSDLNPETRFEK
jgi:hypothetical protein